jgi:hypothetical protein
VVLPSLPDDAIASFCATERGGNRPRAIATRLTNGAGGLTVSGAKRWSTMAPLASTLLVVASEGVDDAGRNRLRVVVVDARSPGLSITTMPPTAFVPEVPHAEIRLDAVAVDPAAVLPGDGYDRYVKPFRTIEDLHVHGAILGYLVSVARRHEFSPEMVERLVASLVGIRALAALDASSAEVHVALAGVLAQDASLIAELAPSWTRVSSDERERWERDRALFGSVAGDIREQRRRRAWETLAGP